MQTGQQLMDKVKLRVNFMAHHYWSLNLNFSQKFKQMFTFQ